MEFVGYADLVLIVKHFVLLLFVLRADGKEVVIVLGERSSEMGRFVMEGMRLMVGALLVLLALFRGKSIVRGLFVVRIPGKMTGGGIGFVVIMVLMLFVTVPSAFATGPPEWVQPPSVLIPHSTRVLMTMTLRSEHLATRWKAEVAPVECEGPVCTSEECKNSTPINGWKVVNEGEISAASPQVNSIHLGQTDVGEGARAPVQLHGLQPETCYDTRFSATNSASGIDGKGELIPAIAVVPFETRPVEEPEIPKSGEDEEFGLHIFELEEITDVSVVASAKVETDGADTKYSFEYSLPEKGKAPSEGSLSWKVFSSGGEGSVTKAEDHARVKASTIGLSPETTYYVRMKLSNEKGTRYQTEHYTGGSESEFFVTGTARAGVSSVVVRNVTGGSAHISGQVEPHGSESSWRFESVLSVSGVCPTSGWAVVSGGSGVVGQAQAEATPYPNAVVVGVGLTGLSSSKVYCVRLSVSNGFGGPEPGGVSFETEGPPGVDTFVVHGLVDGSLRLLGTVNPKSVPTSEEQSITLTGVTGGSFTLAFDGDTTAPIAFDATAESVESALRSLPGEPPVGVQGVAGGPYTVFFGGSDTGLGQSLVTADWVGLTSSPGAAVAVERVQQGGVSNDTRYWFQYVSDKSFAEHAWGNLEETPSQESGFGEVPQLVGALVSGLVGGEGYRFRLLAESSLSGSSPVVGGEERLTVPVTPGVSESSVCPNEAFRTGLSAGLPDCRAYEQLTPLEKGAAQEPFHYRGGIEAALVVGEEGEHAVLEASSVSYGSSTGSGQSPYLFSREESGLGWSMTAGAPQPETGVGNVTPQLYSSDVTQVAFEFGYAPAEASKSPEVEYKVGHVGGPYHKVVSVPRKDTVEKNSRDFSGWVAANGGFSKLVLQTEDHKLLGSETGTLEGSDLYEYTSSGGLKQLNVKGSGDEATTIGSCGAHIVHGHEDAVDNHRASSSRAVSVDGSRVFFEAVSGRDCSEATNLYMRVDGVETVDIGQYKFVAANPQGTELVLENGMGEMGGYDAASKAFEERSSGQLTEESELGFLGVPARFEPQAGDAFARPRYTYWSPTGGQASRYDDAEHVVECISCASTFDSEPKQAAYLGDVEGLPDLNGGSSDFNAVSANGEFAFFTTVSPLVKQDVDEEILPEFNGDTGEFINVGGHTSPSTDVYEWRAAGVSGCGPVQGCLALVTDGRGGYLNLFLGMANEGRDVFFYTRSTLSPADHEPEGSIGEGNVYDARIGGHAAVRPTPPTACEGDACSTPPSPPADSTPSSLTFTGNGNVINEPTKKPVIKKKNAKKKKVKKKKRKTKSKTRRSARKTTRKNTRKAVGRSPQRL